MKIASVILSLIWITFSLEAGNFIYKSPLLPNPANVSWQIEKLISAIDEEEKYQPVSPSEIGIKLTSETKKRNGSVEFIFKAENTTDKRLFLRPSMKVNIPLSETKWWNGYDNINKLKFDPADSILSVWFPTNSAYNNTSGIILGINPLYIYSRVEANKIKDDQGNEQLYIGLPLLIEPGAAFDFSFVVSACQTRYGYHDIIQHWYELFPEAYLPSPNVHPGVISGESSYLYWKPEQLGYSFTPDLIRRLFGGRGSWEWCYKPFIRGGDWAISEKWTSGWNGYTPQKIKEHREKTRGRLQPAAFQDIAPMWYVNVCWTEWSLWKENFPDIKTVEDPKKLKCWSQDTLRNIYPWGNEYGKLFIESINRIPKEYQDSRGIGWDSCFAHQILQENVDGVKNTERKSFIKGRPIIVEAAGVANLLDENHKNYSGDFRMANAVNYKLVAPYIIGARTDTALYEGQPVQHLNRILRIESLKARLGSKPLVWHKGFTAEDMQWLKWEKMSKAEAMDIYRQLSENILFLNYYWGALCSPTIALGKENLFRKTPELIDLIRLGWQPSPSVDAPEDILVARYGKGAGSRIAVINPEFKAQNIKLLFPPEYWNNASLLLCREDGDALNFSISSKGASTEMQMPPRSVSIVKVCGSANITAPDFKMQINSQKIIKDGSEAVIHFEMKTCDTFNCPVEFSRSETGSTAEIKCNADIVKFSMEEKIIFSFNSSRWTKDANNQFTAILDFAEYPKIDMTGIGKLSDLKLIENLTAGRLAINIPANTTSDIQKEAERIADWFRFYSMATAGKLSEPITDNSISNDEINISISVGTDNLEKWQDGKGFIENGRTIHIFAKNEKALHKTITAVLNRFDEAYPYYGVLPEDKFFAKMEMTGKTLRSAPPEKILHPTLLEMLQKNGVK